MNIKRYNTENISEFISEWGEVISTLDIYYQPSFLACDARMQGGTYEVAVCSTENDFWIYPYLLLPISNTEWIDLSSPYGYAGPVCSSEEFGRLAEVEFVREVQMNLPVVTEFVRYHYQYNEHYKFHHNITNLLNRKVVILSLNQHEDFWMNQFSGTNRNLVRKLENDGFEWEQKKFECEDIEAFDQAYRLNMKHTQAEEFYFFDSSFYEQLIDNLGEKLRIARVKKDNVVYAIALFFVSGGIVTYYLSARNLDYPKIPGSNVLLARMCFWAKQNGCTTINFGGGLSLSEDDFLYKFKRNFSKETRDFYIGKRIHNSEKYQELIRAYQARNGVEAFEKVKYLLQFYR